MLLTAHAALAPPYADGAAVHIDRAPLQIDYLSDSQGVW
jgi:hypothetical protein